MLKSRLNALKRDDDNNNNFPLPPPPPPAFFLPPLSLPLTNFPPLTNLGPNLPLPWLPPDLFQPLPPPPPSFSPTDFRLPRNNNQPSTIGNVTNFGEIEAVRGKQE